MNASEKAGCDNRKVTPEVKGAEDVREKKKALRRRVRDLRDSLSAGLMEKEDAGLTGRVLASREYREAGSIFCYVSRSGEPDTLRILSDALSRGKKVYVPRCISRHEMQAVRLLSKEELSPGMYGIPEPPADRAAAGEEELSGISLAVVPCLSAGRGGERLGHGAGYYDRFLKGRGMLRMCLCYEALLSEGIPMDADDLRMDLVVSGAGVYRAACRRGCRKQDRL